MTDVVNTLDRVHLRLTDAHACLHDEDSPDVNAIPHITDAIRGLKETHEALKFATIAVELALDALTEEVPKW